MLESTRLAIAGLGADYAAGEPTPRDGAALAAQRDQLERFALDFAAVAARATGPELRDVLTPWLAGATFDKHTRELALRVRTVPLSLLAAHSPGRVSRQQIRVVTVRVGPKARRVG